MALDELCSRCRMVIPPERSFDSTVVCPHCGHVASPNESKANRYLNSRFRQTAIGLSLLMVVLFVHAVTWDTYFFQVIPLKAKQLVNLASADELGELAVICQKRLNPSCTEKALREASEKQPQDTALLFQLGKTQSQMGLFQQAADTFDRYFQMEGREIEAAYFYAKTLEALNRLEDAATYYEFILEKRPEILQVTVTQNYVRLLKKMEQYQRAITLIQSIRRKGSSAAYFLEAELRQLQVLARAKKRS
jgi:tetratricopeptide (TPR) repeat protein